MAMLATLEGIENNRGTFLGACLGACEMVASTLRGCLGAIPQKKIFKESDNFYIPNFDYTTGYSAIKDDDEKTSDFALLPVLVYRLLSGV